MCRYMFGRYRTHWVCLADRRCFKATWQAPICADCDQPMIDVGKDFHAPRRTNLTQWRKVALLVQNGLLFDSCGCTGPGPRPRTLADASTQFGRRRSARRVYAGRPRYPGRRQLLPS
jgi:hypothetical protein